MSLRNSGVPGKIAALLLVVTVLFQHFELFAFQGYPVTLGFISGVALLFVMTTRYPFHVVSATLAVIVGVSGLAALFGGATNASEYFGTLLLFVVTACIITSAWGQLNTEVLSSQIFARAIMGCLVLLALLSAGQVILGSFGSDVLFNIYGDFQYLRPYDPQLGVVQYPRAHGVFLEPSYNAYVIGALTVALLCLGRYRKTAVIFGVLGMLVTQSATALVLLALVLCLVLIRSRSFGSIAVLVLGAALLWYSGDYLFIRLASLDTDGSSAYYRFIAPLPVLYDVFVSHPFGMALGSVSDVMYGYGLQMAGVRASSLDNGAYVGIFYFGWLGLIALLALLATVIRAVASGLRTRQSLSWIAQLWLMGSIFFSGAIMAPEFGLMTWLVLVCLLFAQTTEKAHDESYSYLVEHRGRYIQRPGRVEKDARLIT